MGAGPHDARNGEQAGDETSIVPGLDPVPQPRQWGRPTGRLDPALDPDRFDPDRPDAGRYDAGPVGPLDPARDPDRFQPPGQGQSLTDLLGEGAHEDERDNYQWVVGLLGVIAFIAFMAWLFGSVLSA